METRHIAHSLDDIADHIRDWYNTQTQKSAVAKTKAERIWAEAKAEAYLDVMMLLDSTELAKS